VTIGITRAIRTPRWIVPTVDALAHHHDFRVIALVATKTDREALALGGRSVVTSDLDLRAVNLPARNASGARLAA